MIGVQVLEQPGAQFNEGRARISANGNDPLLQESQDTACLAPRLARPEEHHAFT